MPTARKVADYLIERPWLGTTAVVTALLWLMAARNPMLSLSPQGGTAPPFPYLFAKQEGTTLTLLGRRAD
ncbi:MAG: hypothetical protein GWN58_21045, partial [Anaerolineae bacterium]|nr:hypothetical protein [Anaerolineae bacterium]